MTTSYKVTQDFSPINGDEWIILETKNLSKAIETAKKIEAAAPIITETDYEEDNYNIEYGNIGYANCFCSIYKQENNITTSKLNWRTQ